MPERHRTEKLLSEQEAKMIRSLARILPAPMLGQPRYSLFPTIPLTSLFSNEPGNSWYSYVQNNLRDVIRLDDSDFVPNDMLSVQLNPREEIVSLQVERYVHFCFLILI